MNNGGFRKIISIFGILMRGNWQKLFVRLKMK